MDLTGKLLAAMPGMQDPRFTRSLILLCSHSTDGAMGIIVNRPMSDVTFPALLDKLGILAPDPAKIDVHYGGPVEPGRGFILHRDGYHSEAAVLDIAGGFQMSATLDVVEALADGTGPCPVLLALWLCLLGPAAVGRRGCR